MRGISGSKERLSNTEISKNAYQAINSIFNDLNEPIVLNGYKLIEINIGANTYQINMDKTTNAFKNFVSVLTI